jgi:uncharacterized membrane protein YjfL (UPF0719 family)
MTDLPLLNAFLFGALGILLFAAAFALVDKLTPNRLWSEIVERHNLPLAILAAAMAIAIGMIVAAAMH